MKITTFANVWSKTGSDVSFRSTAEMLKYLSITTETPDPADWNDKKSRDNVKKATPAWSVSPVSRYKSGQKSAKIHVIGLDFDTEGFDAGWKDTLRSVIGQYVFLAHETWSSRTPGMGIRLRIILPLMTPLQGDDKNSLYRSACLKAAYMIAPKMKVDESKLAPYGVLFRAAHPKKTRFAVQTPLFGEGKELFDPFILPEPPQEYLDLYSTVKETGKGCKKPHLIGKKGSAERTAAVMYSGFEGLQAVLDKLVEEELLSGPTGLNRYSKPGGGGGGLLIVPTDGCGERVISFYPEDVLGLQTHKPCTAFELVMTLKGLNPAETAKWFRDHMEGFEGRLSMERRKNAPVPDSHPMQEEWNEFREENLEYRYPKKGNPVPLWNSNFFEKVLTKDPMIGGKIGFNTAIDYWFFEKGTQIVSIGGKNIPVAFSGREGEKDLVDLISGYMTFAYGFPGMSAHGASTAFREAFAAVREEVRETKAIHETWLAPYLEGLKKTWDGKPRVDRYLLEMGAEDTPFNRAVLRKWMAGIFFLNLQKKTPQDYLVLQTPQNLQHVGKTATFELLSVSLCGREPRMIFPHVMKGQDTDDRAKMTLRCDAAISYIEENDRFTSLASLKRFSEGNTVTGAEKFKAERTKYCTAILGIATNSEEEISDHGDTERRYWRVSLLNGKKIYPGSGNFLCRIGGWRSEEQLEYFRQMWAEVADWYFSGKAEYQLSEEEEKSLFAVQTNEQNSPVICDELIEWLYDQKPEKVSPKYMVAVMKGTWYGDDEKVREIGKALRNPAIRSVLERDGVEMSVNKVIKIDGKSYKGYVLNWEGYVDRKISLRQVESGDMEYITCDVLRCTDEDIEDLREQWNLRIFQLTNRLTGETRWVGQKVYESFNVK